MGVLMIGDLLFGVHFWSANYGAQDGKDKPIAMLDSLGPKASLKPGARSSPRSGR